MIVNRPGLAIAAITALVFCFLPPSEPALALTMGVLPPNPLEADSIVQFLGISPVAIPPPAPGSFFQAVGANPPDFAKSLFQRSILDLCSTCQPIASGTANIAMGAVTFGAFVSAAGDNVASAATAVGSFVDDLMVNPPPGVSGNGTILVPLHVTGSVGIVSTTVVGQPPILTQAGFSIFCATSTLSGPGGGVCGGSNPIAFSVSVPHPSQFIFDHSQPVDMSLLLTVPFTFGQEFLLDRQVWFTAGEIPQSICDDCHFQATVEGHFEDTGTWGAATVRDALGNVVPGATILSASGIDYLNPTAGPPKAAVPEPGTFAMLLAGCLLLALRPCWAYVMAALHQTGRFSRRAPGRDLAAPWPQVPGFVENAALKTEGAL